MRKHLLCCIHDITKLPNFKKIKNVKIRIFSAMLKTSRVIDQKQTRITIIRHVIVTPNMRGPTYFGST